MYSPSHPSYSTPADTASKSARSDPIIDELVRALADAVARNDLKDNAALWERYARRSRKHRDEKMLDERGFEDGVRRYRLAVANARTTWARLVVRLCGSRAGVCAKLTNL